MSDEPVTTVAHDAGVVTVSLHGEVDVLTVDQVRKALVTALDRTPTKIIVDLTALSFIDSTGLGALVSGFQRARDQGIGYELAHPRRGVRQVLVLSGLLEVVPLTE